MAKKRTTRPAPPRTSVTAERFARLYRLLQMLAPGAQTRAVIIRRLKLDVRGFYRDLVFLRAAGINVTLTGGRYGLADALDDALARLPFPDPRLTLGEARQLARGRTLAHRHLQQEINRTAR
jgi:predicted DNA-binding transcriptional regulator YafY